MRFRSDCAHALPRTSTAPHVDLLFRLPSIQVALQSQHLMDVLQWPIVYQPLDGPISGPVQLCALLEATLCGTPLASFDVERMTLALRQTIFDLPLVDDPGRTALVSHFNDVTLTGTPVKCGFNCGFPHRPQKNWKYNYAQQKEARESGSCAKSFNATHGSTYGTLVGLCNCGCIQGSSTVVKAEGCKDIHAFLRRYIFGPVRVVLVPFRVVAFLQNGPSAGAQRRNDYYLL